MATVKYAVVLTLLIQEVQGLSVKFTGSLGYNSTVAVSPATCKGLIGSNVEGSTDSRLECMDLKCSDPGCGTDLFKLVKTGLEGVEAGPLKTSVKSQLAPPTAKVGFIWSGFVFPGQVYHEYAKHWEDHSLTPKHTLRALLNGITPISGYTLDMTPFGYAAMEFIPDDFCKEDWKYKCDEGPLYHQMWEVASDLYAEKILDGGTFGIIANGRSRDHLATSLMGKVEVPRITKVLERYTGEKKLQAIVYNMMDVPPAGDIKCGELASTEPGNQFKAYGAMKKAVEKAGGKYHCFDCSDNRNRILEYGYNSLKQCIDAHRFDEKGLDLFA